MLSEVVADSLELSEPPGFSDPPESPPEATSSSTLEPRTHGAPDNGAPSHQSSSSQTSCFPDTLCNAISAPSPTAASAGASGSSGAMSQMKHGCGHASTNMHLPAICIALDWNRESVSCLRSRYAARLGETGNARTGSCCQRCRLPGPSSSR